MAFTETFQENQRTIRRARGGALFELNVRESPDAWNPWESLGDECAAAGDPRNAVRAYRRSLELNPENENARRMLRTLSP